MHALLGQKLTDTQTGLRGIPATLLPKLMRMESTGYEFELEMLIAAHQLEIPMVEEPIRTIYEAGNKSSHFNPIVDSMKIYFVLLRFGSVSVMTALIDNLIFILVIAPDGQCSRRRRCSGRVFAVAFNYSMVRSSVFYSKQQHKTVLPKYLTLVVASGTASYAGHPVPARAVRRQPDSRQADGGDAALLRQLRGAAAVHFQAAGGRRRGTAEGPGLDVFHAGGDRICGAAGSGDSWTGDQPSVRAIDLAAGRAQALHPLRGRILALAVPLLAMVPWTFATLVSVLILVLTGLAAGPAALLAVAFFLISSNALGARILGAGFWAGPNPTHWRCSFAPRLAGDRGVRFPDDLPGAPAGELSGRLGSDAGDPDPPRSARGGKPDA